MDPTTVFCPNLACPARGQTGQGNIGIHSRKDKRFLCTECHKTFSTTKGTAFYRLRTAAETVTLVVTLLAHGCPPQAIVAAFALAYARGTVMRWMARGGVQGQAVQEHLVEQPRDLGQVQADEIRVKKQGGIVWMALAMMVRTRLWLAGEVSERRDMALSRGLIERVRRCALPRPLLVCTDGWSAYVRAVRETFRDPVHAGAQGRPRLRPWRNICIAQVVKRYERRRVVDVERRIVDGTPARVETLRRRSQGDGVINTAYIERLNATFRARLGPLTRRGRALARRTLTLQHGMYLIGTVYNFCTPHASLRGAGGATTPAMAAGITAHCWTVQELLSFHVPPPRWTPPKQRGASLTCAETPAGALVLVTTVNCGATKRYHGLHEPLITQDLFDCVQAVLTEKGQRPTGQQKHAWAFQGLLSCGHCGCAFVAEIKKQRYVYYHCTGNKGGCPEKYVREEEIARQFGEALRAIQLDEEVLSWIVTALKASHQDTKKYHDERVTALQKQYQKLQDRLDRMYIDKLDGSVSQDQFERMSETFRKEQSDLLRQIEKHQQANQTYLDEGIRLLELSQNVVSLYFDCLYGLT